MKDIWPSNEEIHDTVRKAVTREDFASSYATVFEGDDAWKALEAPTGEIFDLCIESSQKILPRSASVLYYCRMRYD